MSFDVDVTVRRGERAIVCRFASAGGITALVGPSGAGKSSVLEALAGLLRPEAGRIAVGGTVLFDSLARVNLPPEARACGVMFQDLRLFPHRRVLGNLLYGQRLAPPERRFLSLEEVADFLDIAPLLGRRPRTLSGGEAQRVAIGRALLSGPRFLLMDEPLTALDDARREAIIAVIERIRDELALPILLVSHDRADVARLADTVVELRP
ncbi:molybdenum ABC transporter ATP-binding protein [Novosphingobium fuchskuhlense]|uniref:Molybdenum ABC transporter ATP-binding protein n=1 Tax=Novosphingobium fuchskuhlense TaxID=1117702 RepID=A0A124JTM7_9SPHN|nr:ATP-binding cassette domain-containing protein [Novosphingobium fuchskuhlense]KUR70339.1 molybdenum ABC transporter ATP-binding protein [Novosphingobium fuchskuhlense]